MKVGRRHVDSYVVSGLSGLTYSSRTDAVSLAQRFSARPFDGRAAASAFARYLSADLVVVPRGVLFGPILRVRLVFAPRAVEAACFPRARRPAPAFTLFWPGFSIIWPERRLGGVPVTLRLLPRSPPSFL